MLTKIKNGTGLIIRYKDNYIEAFDYIENRQNFIDSEGALLSPLVPIIFEEDLNMCLSYLEMIDCYKLIKDYKGEEIKWKK